MFMIDQTMRLQARAVKIKTRSRLKLLYTFTKYFVSSALIISIVKDLIS